MVILYINGKTKKVTELILNLLICKMKN